jgi:hypothetical protein
MNARRNPRFEFKVIHRHRIGPIAFGRVSELLFIGGVPKAVLTWIDMAGIRTPICCDLKPTRLRIPRGHARLDRLKRTYYYDETTSDPRYEDAPHAAAVPDSPRTGVDGSISSSIPACAARDG